MNSRYDYEECDVDKANAMMSHLRSMVESGSLVNEQVSSDSSDSGEGQTTYTVQLMDDFGYIDPIDKTLTTKQVALHSENMS